MMKKDFKEFFLEMAKAPENQLDPWLRPQMEELAREPNIQKLEWLLKQITEYCMASDFVVMTLEIVLNQWKVDENE